MRAWLITASQSLSAVRRRPSAESRKPSPTVHKRGTYICIEGPSFSTRAESLMHRQWGADVVGMTALPEARLAREAEMAYALIALPTDYDCWRTATEPQMNTDERELGGADSPFFSGRGSGSGASADNVSAAPAGEQSLLAEIIANLNCATDASIALIKAALADVGLLWETPSPAHRALELAIWSEKSKIDCAEVERLRTLWDRHFD